MLKLQRPAGFSKPRRSLDMKEDSLMAKLLWKPSEEQIKNSNMYAFMNQINETYHKNFREYKELYQWSVENIPEFYIKIISHFSLRLSFCTIPSNHHSHYCLQNILCHSYLLKRNHICKSEYVS